MDEHCKIRQIGQKGWKKPAQINTVDVDEREQAQYGLTS